MLVVRKSDSGSAYLKDELDVLVVVAGEKRVTDAESVLMAGYTAEGIFLAVEDKAVLGVDLEASAAESGLHLVDKLATSLKRSLERIKIRISKTVPEVSVLELKVYKIFSSGELLYGVALLVKDGKLDFVALLLVSYEYLCLNVSVRSVKHGVYNYSYPKLKV